MKVIPGMIQVSLGLIRYPRGCSQAMFKSSATKQFWFVQDFPAFSSEVLCSRNALIPRQLRMIGHSQRGRMQLYSGEGGSRAFRNFGIPEVDLCLKSLAAISGSSRVSEKTTLSYSVPSIRRGVWGEECLFMCRGNSFHFSRPFVQAS